MEGGREGGRGGRGGREGREETSWIGIDTNVSSQGIHGR